MPDSGLRVVAQLAFPLESFDKQHPEIDTEVYNKADAIQPANVPASNEKSALPVARPHTYTSSAENVSEDVSPDKDSTGPEMNPDERYIDVTSYTSYRNMLLRITGEDEASMTEPIPSLETHGKMSQFIKLHVSHIETHSLREENVQIVSSGPHYRRRRHSDSANMRPTYYLDSRLITSDLSQWGRRALFEIHHSRLFNDISNAFTQSQYPMRLSLPSLDMEVEHSLLCATFGEHRLDLLCEHEALLTFQIDQIESAFALYR